MVLLELVAFTPRDAHCFWQLNQISEIKFQKTEIIFINQISDITAKDVLANRFKNLYRGQLFNFWSAFSPLAFGNEHLKKLERLKLGRPNLIQGFENSPAKENRAHQELSLAH